MPKTQENLKKEPAVVWFGYTIICVYFFLMVALPVNASVSQAESDIFTVDTRGWSPGMGGTTEAESGTFTVDTRGWLPGMGGTSEAESDLFTVDTRGWPLGMGGAVEAESDLFTVDTRGWPAGVSGFEVSAESDLFTVDTRCNGPTIACAEDKSLEFASRSGAVVSFDAVATGDCPPITVTCVPPSGSTFPIGETTVHCSAVDIYEHKAECGFTIMVLGGQGKKQNVLKELTTLRAGVTTRADCDRLDAAIAYLNSALTPALWLDQTHLIPKKGDSVFQDEKDAVLKMSDLISDRRSTVPAVTLQNFIERLVAVDRLLAEFSLQEAVAAGANPLKVAEDQGQIDEGDADAAANRPENAIEHYRNAWNHAVHLQVRSMLKADSSGVTLQFIAYPR